MTAQAYRRQLVPDMQSGPSVCDVADPNVEPVVLPVGFEKFHRRGFLNYQFNRAHGLGWADGNELRDAAARTRSTEDCVSIFEDLSAQAAADRRLRHAVGYLRLAEFFTPPRSAAKVERYRRFRALFDAAFSGGGLIRHAIPYAGASLPAYWLPAGEQHPSGEAVLIHGGFDSLIEEFYPIWQRIAVAGFDVVAFEGPGQGGARALSGLTFDHDWERPVGAVLDYFGLASAGLVGISMGGYWALRAAGREPRIDRVVAWPPVFDWLYRLPAVMRGPVRIMLRRRRLMRWSVRTRARLIPTLRQIVDHTLYLVDSHDPIDVVDWFLGMNADHLGSAQVTQDVLLMCGEHDSFQPPSLTRAQAKALTAARSVTVRMFTKAEDADQHCQIGNIGLACRVLTTWLRHTSPEPTGLD
jgi:pimeloyl-ACP methyl ester carboxylesterase